MNAPAETAEPETASRRIRRAPPVLEPEPVAEGIAAEPAADGPDSRPAEFVEGDIPIMTRRKRGEHSDDMFHIPQKYKKPGWDYEWKTTRVMGQPADIGESALYYDQGWRPVTSGQMPDMIPPGFESKFIERGGMILMTRPMYLTTEARQEDYDAAERQKVDKLKASLADGPVDVVKQPGKIKGFSTEITIEGEAGAAPERSAAARQRG